MGKLENKRALVTGSSSGIGAGVALAFAREGADVIINYPTPNQREAAEKIVEQVRSAGRKSKAIQADVSEAAQVAQLVEGSVAAEGHVSHVRRDCRGWHRGGDGTSNRGSCSMALSGLAVKFDSGILPDDLLSGH